MSDPSYRLLLRGDQGGAFSVRTQSFSHGVVKWISVKMFFFLGRESLGQME